MNLNLLDGFQVTAVIIHTKHSECPLFANQRLFVWLPGASDLTPGVSESFVALWYIKMF